MPEFPQPTSPRTVVATKMPANTFFIISYSFSFFDLYVYFRSRFIFDFYVNFNLALFSIFLFLCQFYFSGAVLIFLKLHFRQAAGSAQRLLIRQR